MEELKMTRDQKKEVKRLYEVEGMSYGGIAKKLGLPKSTVSSHIMRARTKSSEIESSEKNDTHHCICCGKEIEAIPGKKIKKFCSKKCSNNYYRKNKDFI